MRRIQLLASLSFALSGCATLSFAPPQVRMDKEVIAQNSERFFDAKCTPRDDLTGARDIREDVDGALILVNNYMLIYRCQADRAAEGKNFFDLPSFGVGLG